MRWTNYLAQVQAGLLASLRNGPCTISAAIREHGLVAPEGFETRRHAGITGALRKAGIIETVRIDRSASPKAHRAFVTLWRLVRHG